MTTAIAKRFNAPAEFPTADEAVADLKKRYTGLKILDGDKRSYENVRLAIADIRKTRVEVENRRKELKADALEFGRKVDAEAKRITSQLVALEAPLIEQKSAIDEAKERAKQEAEEAEARAVQEELERLRAAEKARVEAEQKAERERLEKERAEIEAQRKALAAEQQAAADARAKEAAENEAARQKLLDEQRAIEVRRREVERLELERQARDHAEREAAEKARREREEAEVMRIAQEAEAKRQEAIAPARAKANILATKLEQVAFPNDIEDAEADEVFATAWNFVVDAIETLRLFGGAK